MSADEPGLLLIRDLATRRGIQVNSVARSLARSRARVAGGLQLRPSDLPLPDAPPLIRRRTERPRWRADGPIAAWLTTNTTNPPTTDRQETHQ